MKNKKHRLIKEYKNGNFKVSLYGICVEIKHKVVGGTEVDVILVRDIASVKLPFGKRLEIKTNDGKKHFVNLMPKDLKDLKNRIMELI